MSTPAAPSKVAENVPAHRGRYFVRGSLLEEAIIYRCRVRGRNQKHRPNKVEQLHEL